MRTFTFHIEGDREDLPAIEWVTVRDDARAVELAARRLTSWTFLHAIEVRDGARVVSRLERAQPAPPAGDSREAGA